MSPISADASEPPPSTTSTRPSPGVFMSFFTSPLSRWQRTVATGPANDARPP